MAVEKGYAELVDALLAAGADKEAKYEVRGGGAEGGGDREGLQVKLIINLLIGFLFLQAVVEKFLAAKDKEAKKVDTILAADDMEAKNWVRISVFIRSRV